MRSAVFMTLVGLVLLGAPGCESSAVGLTCAADRLQCGGACVDPETDPGHCGGCGLACAPGESCADARCVALGDDGGPPTDGGVAGATDAGRVSCAGGERRCGDVCARLDRDPSHCGACGARCDGASLCVEGACVPLCEAPLAACGGTCVDLEVDPDHCGACGRACPSGLCAEGACAGSYPGHVVLIGHDYSAGRAGMNRLVGNAVFMPFARAVEVLVFDEATPGATRVGVARAVDEVAREQGRSWRATAVSAADVPTELAGADVFLVEAQSTMDDARLLALGREWRDALDAFLRRGGVVVALDGPGPNGGTHQLLEAAGLFEARGRVEAEMQMLDVVDTRDAVSVGVPRRYWAEPGTVAFEGVSRDVVVEGETGAIVVHGVFE